MEPCYSVSTFYRKVNGRGGCGGIAVAQLLAALRTVTFNQGTTGAGDSLANLAAVTPPGNAPCRLAHHRLSRRINAVAPNSAVNDADNERKGADWLAAPFHWAFPYPNHDLSSEIPGPHRSANRVRDQTRGRDAGDCVHISGQRDFDNIHTDQPSLLGQPMDKPVHLQIGDTTGRGPSNRQHDGWVHAVGINRAVVLLAVGNLRQNIGHAAILKLIDRDQVEAISPCSINLFGSGAALAAQADLEDLVNVIYLCCPADRARIAFPGATVVIAPIEMRIDLDQMDWSDFFKDTKHWDR